MSTYQNETVTFCFAFDQQQKETVEHTAQTFSAPHPISSFKKIFDRRNLK